jgi:UDP-glucose 4-epimerase
MSKKIPARHKLTVAVTGATGDFGNLLLPLLEADPSVERVLAVGLKPAEGKKVEFRRVDLSRPDAELELADVLGEYPVDVLYHLAFLYRRVQNGNLAHELEVIGTMQLLAAISRAKVPRIIVPSTTALYGARRDHPALMREDQVLEGCPASRFVTDKVQVEHQLEAFRTHHPGIKTTILRFAPMFGKALDNPATRLLRQKVVPTLLGHDPLWQGIHSEDVGAALHLALHADVDGAFNVVANGVMPLSAILKHGGTQAIPLPSPVARATLRTLNGLGVTSVPLNMLDYLQYSWTADGERARQELGFIPRHDIQAAVESMRSN